MIRGMDVSHWQGKIDWAVAWAAGIKFAFMKAVDFNRTTRKGFRDTCLYANMQGAGEAGIPRGMYAWLQPGISGKEQAKYFMDAWLEYPSELPPVVDFEDPAGKSNSAYLHTLAEWLDVVTAKCQIQPIVYTGWGFMRSFGSGTDWLRKYPLWLAQYTLFETAPVVPKPWSKWSFWQYTAKGDGRKYGVSSREIDLDYYQGTVEELMVMAQIEIAEQAAGKKPALQWKVMVDMLNVRSTPNTEHAPVGKVLRGEIVTELERFETNGNTWIRIGAERWCAARYNGHNYLTSTGE